MELSINDAGMEDCSLPGSWKHCGAQTCTGKNIKLILNKHAQGIFIPNNVWNRNEGLCDCFCVEF